MPPEDNKSSALTWFPWVALVVIVVIFAFGISAGNIQIKFGGVELNLTKDDLQKCLDYHWEKEKAACIGTIGEWAKDKHYLWAPEEKAVLLENSEALKQAGLASIKNPDFDLIQQEMIEFDHCNQFEKVAKVAEECQNRITPKVFVYTATFDDAPAKGELRFNRGDANLLGHLGEGCSANLLESDHPDTSIPVWVGKPVGLNDPNRVQLRETEFVRLVSEARHQDMPARSSKAWSDITALGTTKVKLHCFQVSIDP